MNAISFLGWEIDRERLSFLSIQIQISTHRGQGQAMTQRVPGNTSDIRRDNHELKTGLKNALATLR